MKVLVIEKKSEGYGTLVKIGCKKAARKVIELAQVNRPQAILETLASGRIIRRIAEEEFGSIDIDLMIREYGTCWDLMK